MAMHVHEIHAAAIHAPLVFLPAAAIVDIAAIVTGDRRTARLGSKLWWATAASGLFAGVAGMAASQEVKTDDRTADDKMWLHGIANVAVVTGALAIAGWRTRHRPNVGLAIAGVAAAGASMYTAYLGGEMVYTHGIGVKPMPGFAPGGVRNSPRLLSPEAPKAFVRDAARGLSWLVRRLAALTSGNQPMASGAFGLKPRGREIFPPV